VNKTLVAAVVAGVAVFAGVVYFAREPATPGPAAGEPAPKSPVAAEAAKPTTTRAPVSRQVPPSRPVASDPRLAALMVSPDRGDGLIEFFADAEGRVINEIDNDPNSARYRKPLREYTYAGDKVIRLVAYKDLGNQVQIITANVVYKPDGSVDRYDEQTRYEHGK